MAQVDKHTVSLQVELGLRIRHAREEIGLSQDALSRKVHLSRASIVQIERGQRKQVKPDVVSRIADALGKSEEYFYITGESRQVSASISPALRDAWTKMITLPQPRQEQLGQLLERLLVW